MWHSRIEGLIILLFHHNNVWFAPEKATMHLKTAVYWNTFALAALNVKFSKC